jgi:hypothetical protein
MAQYNFGAGSLWGTSTNANSTPIRFGGMQGVQVDFSFTTKELYSSYQMPIALGRGAGKIDCKASFAQFNALILNDLFFNLGSAPSTTEIKVADNEAGAIPGSSTYTITVSNSATFTEDLGVIYADGANAGIAFTKVASSPAVGQYSVSAGVYTFASADASKNVKISYKYTVPSAGKTLTITNQLLGSAAFFSANLVSQYNGKQMIVTLNRCMSNKLTLPLKLEDFTIADFEFSAFADDSNEIGKISLVE